MNKVKTNTKYIFVTGGVLSGVGKGITAASIGAILKAKGYKVSIQKCDPYLNVDAGLLNPAEHGECFVTKDGAETDLDLGHYERFLDEEMTRHSATLAGRLMRDLIMDERAGKFHGQTIQLIPHLTNRIKEEIHAASQGSDVHIVEIGGTVGDYEGLSFIEAIRTFAGEVGYKNCLYISVVFVPYLSISQELKTKPAQNALRDLRGFGIIPDIVAVRTEKPAPKAIGDKIAKFAGIDDDAVILLPDIASVYDVPLNIMKSGVLTILNEFMHDHHEPDMTIWRRLSAQRAKIYAKTISVGLVAKYIENHDTYKSVTEALQAAAFHNKVNLNIEWIDAENVTEQDLAKVDGILVPGGFGTRGVEGKILAADYALGNDKPYLGICLGMQVAVIAAARRAGLKNADSEEFNRKTPENVIYIMKGQRGQENTGGTLRLGDCPAKLVPGTQTNKIYDSVSVVERHRHRYEVNQKFIQDIEKGGLVVSGTSPNGKLVEFVEAPKNKFFVATQSHPEFRSRPFRAHPLFDEFVKALK